MAVGAVAALGFLFSSATSFALPTSKEVYRNSKLKTIVYEDRLDKSTFWFVPPVKLYESNGKVVFYKREVGNAVVFTFHVVPFMPDDFFGLLAGEIPGLQSEDQLKPVTARRFGIDVPLFKARSMTDDRIKNFQYLNNPHPVRVVLGKEAANEFEFYIANKPGVQSTVFIEFETEVLKKDLKVEVSHKEVYDYINATFGGKYKFTQAELSSALSKYLSQKYVTMEGKGDLPIPDFVSRAITECFKREAKPAGRSDDWRDDDWRADPNGPIIMRFMAEETSENTSQAVEEFIRQSEALGLEFEGPGPGYDAIMPDGRGIGGPSDVDLPPLPDNGGSSDFPPLPGNNGGDIPPFPDGPGGDLPPLPPLPDTSGGGNGGKPGKTRDGIFFTLKREIANSDKVFFFKRLEYADSSDVVGIPVYLSLQPEATLAQAEIELVDKKTFSVDGNQTMAKPFVSGVEVKKAGQYEISASCKVLAANWARTGRVIWDTKWGNIADELYYRVGSGPWNSVGNRALIKTTNIHKGKIQFAINRDRVWNMIPAELRTGTWKTMWMPVLTYDATLPACDVEVTGKKVTAR